MSYICAGLLTAAAVSGCGGSKKNETIPTTVAIFNSHSLIFRNNTAMTMGYNAFGQLGDNSLENRAVATKVFGLGHMTGGAAGAEHTLAFSNHTSVVMAWGYNAYGQLGDPAISTSVNTAFSSTPVKVQLERPVTGVAAGSFHSLAVANGSIYAWGYNGYGQVGNGNTTNQNKPVKLTNYTGASLNIAKSVAAGGYHSAALLTNGIVYAWGDNSYGQLAFSPNSTAKSNIPVKVPVPVTAGQVEAIAAGGKFTLALEVVRDAFDKIIGQTLWGWGFDGVGQLGIDPASATLPKRQAGKNDTAYTRTPVAVRSIPTADATTIVIKKFVAGTDHILLLLGARDSNASDGSWTVEAVGYNYFGQLGDNMGLGGTSTEISSFMFVHTIGIGGTGNLTGVTDIAAFGQHSLAKVGGVWYGWGNNDMGQLGNPASTSSAGNLKIPVLVQGQ
ncbi:RCC1 domain-containing protein [Citrifermentans bremense]|uniref:RCC1 domain-containing protein n=1 Tax=Citrifermentans bremense TaxID=60035 RepID=UPI0003FBC559|nr:chromosome condensation regulator RCC1 [Citrifermentans bremense]